MTDALPEQEWKPGDSPILPPLPDSAYPPDATPLAPVHYMDVIRASLANTLMELGGEVSSVTAVDRLADGLRCALSNANYQITPEPRAKTKPESQG